MATKNQIAVRIMEHLVTDPNHGYSQISRNGDGTGWCDVVIDGKTYKVARGDRDCSSAVINAYQAAGVDCGGATYTGNMMECMTATGNFEWVGINDYSAQPGDIYLNRSYHTAMCLTAYGSPEGDRLMEFSGSEYGTIDGAEGDQTGWESHIAAYYDYPWDGILRYTGRADGVDWTQPTVPGFTGQQSGVQDGPIRALTVPVHYALHVRGGGWWPTVNDFGGGSEGYAGAPYTAHDMLIAWADRGQLKYRVHTIEDGWLGWVAKGDWNDSVNGMAGIWGRTIDGVQMYYVTPSGERYSQAWYRSQTTMRAGWLPVCCDDGTTYAEFDGWAGMLGEPLDRLQIAISDGNPFQ